MADDTVKGLAATRREFMEDEDFLPVYAGDTGSHATGRRYTDKAAYEDFVLQLRVKSHPLYDADKLESVITANPGMTPDAAIAALTQGLDGDSKTVASLIEVQTQAKQARLAQEQAAKLETARVKAEAEDEAEEDEKGALRKGAEAFVRTGMAGLISVGQVTSGVAVQASAVAQELTGTDIDGDATRNADLIDPLGMFKSNYAYQALSGDSLGEGWMPDDISEGGEAAAAVDEARQQLMVADYTNANGEQVTRGAGWGDIIFNSTSGITGWAPGDASYDTATALGNIGFELIGDPTLAGSPFKALKAVRAAQYEAKAAKFTAKAARQVYGSNKEFDLLEAAAKFDAKASKLSKDKAIKSGFKAGRMSADTSKVAARMDEVDTLVAQQAELVAARTGMSVETARSVVGTLLHNTPDTAARLSEDTYKAAVIDGVKGVTKSSKEARHLAEKLQEVRVPLIQNAIKAGKQQTTKAVEKVAEKAAQQRRLIEDADPAAAMRLPAATADENVMSAARAAAETVAESLAKVTGEDATALAAVISKQGDTVEALANRVERIARGGESTTEAMVRGLKARDDFAEALVAQGFDVAGIRGFADHADMLGVVGRVDKIVAKKLDQAFMRAVVEAADAEEARLLQTAADKSAEARELATVAYKKHLNRALPSSVDDADLTGFLRGQFGISTATEGGTVSMNRMLDAITSNQGAAIAKAISETSDEMVLWDLTRGSLRMEQIPVLAKMTDPADIQRYLAEQFAVGNIAPTLGRMRMLRAHSRFVGNIPAGQADAAAQAAWGVPAKVVKWSVDTARRKASSAYNSVHLGDEHAVLGYVSDTLAQVTKKASAEDAAAYEAVRRSVGTKLMNATSPGERMNLAIGAMEQVQKIALASALKGVDPSDAAKIEEGVAEAMSITKQRMQGRIHHNVAEETAEGVSHFAPGGVSTELKTLAVWEDNLTNYLSLPPVADIERAVKGTKALLAKGKTGDVLKGAVTELFGSHWKTLVLVGRPSYVIRNLLEMQIRMFMSAHPSALTNPLGFIALVTHAQSGGKFGETAVGKLVAKAAQAPTMDATGQKLGRVLDEDADVAAMMDERVAFFNDSGSMADFGGTTVRTDTFAETVAATDKRFPQALSQKIIQMYSSATGREVFKVMAGKPSETVKAIQRKFPEMTPEEAVTHHFFAGEGRATLDSIMSSQARRKQPLAKPGKKKGGVGSYKGRERAELVGAEFATEWERRLSTRQGVHEFLWGKPGGAADASVGSVRERWELFTNGRNPHIFEELTSTKYTNRVPSGKPVPWAERADMEKVLAKVVKRAIRDDLKAGTFKINQVDFISPKMADSMETSLRQVSAKVQKGVDLFFYGSGVVERSAATHPEYAYAYWDRVADLVDVLPRVEAEKLAALAKSELGGHITGKWANQTLTKINRNLKKATDDGVLTRADLDSMADKWARDHVKKLFYDARSTNQLAQSLRLISPFAQASLNSYKTYTRLIAEKPMKVAQVTKFADAFTDPATGALYDVIPGGMDRDEDAGFFYMDPNTRQLSFSAPAYDRAMHGLLMLAGLKPGSKGGSPGLTSPMPLSSLNVITQNELVPSAGPLVQIGIGWLEKASTYRALQARLDSWGLGEIGYWGTPMYQDPSTAPKTPGAQLVPRYVQAIYGLVSPEATKHIWAKYTAPMMSALVSQHPERYLTQHEDGTITYDQDLLVKDATRRAADMAASRTMANLFSAGSMQPDVKIHAKDGGTVALAVVDKEVNALVDEGRSRAEAASMMMDKYGPAAILAMTYSSEFMGDTTTTGYNFFAKHPAVAEKHQDVIGNFFPDGAFSMRFYQQQKKAGLGEKMDETEVITAANNLLKEAQVWRIEDKVAKGELTAAQGEDALYQVTSAFKEDGAGGFDPGAGKANRIKKLMAAVEEPEVAATPAGQALTEYLQLREQGIENLRAAGINPDVDNPFRTKASVNIRAYLMGEGERLVSEYPEFRSLWTKELSYELEEN